MKNNDYMKLGFMNERGVHVCWKSWSQALSEIRRQSGVPQDVIAKEFKYSISQVSRIETGKVEPPIDFLLKFSKKFEVNIKWLLSGEGPAHHDLPFDVSSLNLFHTKQLEEEIGKRKKVVNAIVHKAMKNIDEIKTTEYTCSYNGYVNKVEKIIEDACPNDSPAWLKEDVEALIRLREK